MAATVTGVGVGFSLPCSSKLTTQTTSPCSVKMVMLCVVEKKKRKNFTLKISEETFTANASKIACSYELSKPVQKLGTSSIKCKMIHTRLWKHKTMESSSFTRASRPLITSSSCKTEQISKFPVSRRNLCWNQTFLSYSTTLYATLNSPRGFGRTPKKVKKTKESKTGNNNDDDEDEDEDEEPEEGIIPEIVTNRMISRMGFSVGIPLFIGLLFFPFFYYLKVVLKIDVPTWVPFIVSFFFFGTALLGVSYGIVSSSWDPMREGSLLGWNEAQKNWPVFWQSLWGGSRKK